MRTMLVSILLLSTLLACAYRVYSGRIAIPDGDNDGQFLCDLRDGACRVFDSVLGPEYNAAHRNHFHLDRGDYRMCR
jgi:hypothetical protein